MKKYYPLVVLFLVVLALQAILSFSIYSSIDTWTERGTFGDMFGAINTLFSGLAFAGVIYAIILQSRELELQRNELRQSREQFEIGNKLTKMELLNDYWSRYDSNSFRVFRREAAKLLIQKKELPVDDFEYTRNVDEVLNFLQELGLAQKHGVIDLTFVAGRFGGLARCYYTATKEYINEIRKNEGSTVWESVDVLVVDTENEVPVYMDEEQLVGFLRRESELESFEKNGAREN